MPYLVTDSIPDVLSRLKMDSAGAGISRAKSLDLTPTRPQSLSPTASAETVPTADGHGGPSLSRRSSFGKKLVGSSPGKKAAYHVRRTMSGQIKVDAEEVGGGASLSRASSASLGFSFSFTGFTALPEDIASDARYLSGDENGD